jgi:hypothetical protein
MPSGSSDWIVRHTERVLAAAILATLALKFVLIARISVNWDEFYFLELVHQYARGELAIRPQTFHVHLFSWLPHLGWDVIDQIVAGRFVMAVLATGSAFLIYGIARRLVARHGALFALLAYLSVTAVVQHSASFRVDPIVTFLSLLSLFALLCRPSGAWGAVLAGAAMALAVLVTIKSALYLIVIGGILWCIAPNLRERAKLALAFAAAFSAVAAAFYLFHSATLAQQPTAQAAAGAGTFLGRAASKMFFDSIFPRALDLIQMTLANPLFWIMLVEGALAAWAVARKTENRTGWTSLLPLVLALPVLTSIVYRNAFDYFYPFILAPAAVLVGFSFEKHLKAAPRPSGLSADTVVAILVVAQCAILVFNAVSRLGDHIQPQRQTIAEVRAIFPEPVAHIEGFGMFPDYPRTGFFMSSWGVENYRRAGKPIFAELVARDRPVFILADAPSLYGALVPGITVIEKRTFLPEDVRFLQEHYIRHWGMLFVAGKRIEATGGEASGFSIAVPGEYRLEAAMPAVIDETRVEPNGIVALVAGDHTIALGAGAGAATLRWAAASHVPARAPVDPLTFFERKSWAGMTHDMMRQAESGLGGPPQ